jgi:hypothetical protein
MKFCISEKVNVTRFNTENRSKSASKDAESHKKLMAVHAIFLGRRKLRMLNLEIRLRELYFQGKTRNSLLILLLMVLSGHLRPRKILAMVKRVLHDREI